MSWLSCCHQLFVVSTFSGEDQKLFFSLYCVHHIDPISFSLVYYFVDLLLFCVMANFQDPAIFFNEPVYFIPKIFIAVT